MDYIEIANRVYEERYSDAKFLILAGSIVRGEGTKTSDLDIVVIYEKIDKAFRESFIYEGTMIEVFAHDISTLKYFMYNIDYNDGRPVMASMVNEGVVIPSETELSNELKRIAKDHIKKGPKETDIDKIDSMRYNITNLLDDLKDSRNRNEQTAIAVRLYEDLAELYFRSRRCWRGKGKSIVRIMKKYDPDFASKYNESFNLLFKKEDSSKVIELGEELLNSVGGYLFEGYKLEANKEWRID
ncbi:nucleotidyltransferase domain-containing protein [Dethiothermospora halolimnae]|uniref:nucleotidyltransferase domain-containing protein n=1 Tax=Dethiothermospora halolimnae TaxID=3114390 RepID=UPI003CCB9E1A